MVDHLVYATPDLNRGIDDLEKLLGIRATPGGQHLGIGTRNALIALGPTTYFEIIGPDPEQPEPEKPRWFGLDTLRVPQLTAWFATVNDLGKLVTHAAEQGVKLGTVLAGSRRPPMGLSYHGSLPIPAWSLRTASCRDLSIGGQRFIPRAMRRRVPHCWTSERNIPTQLQFRRYWLDSESICPSRPARGPLSLQASQHRRVWWNCVSGAHRSQG